MAILKVKGEKSAAHSADDLEYEVMPAMEGQARSAPAGATPATLPDSLTLPPSPEGGTHWLRLALYSLISLAVLGALGYFGYQYFTKPAEPEKALPDIQVDQTIETKDTDKDGLSDSREKTIGTKSEDADSDGDGLSDGDEVDVYLSDPLLSDTDADGFDDGREVARGYSPVVKTTERASATEIQKWTAAIAQYGLHEPTQTTLKLKAENAEVTAKTTYTNLLYKYSFEHSTLLATREAEDGRNVGIYINGITPDDADVTTDPMSVTLAVRAGNETLSGWIDGQYKAGTDYQTRADFQVGTLKAIRLNSMPGEGCDADRAFYMKNDQIFIITWTCNQSTILAQLYENILQSFKFTK